MKTMTIDQFLTPAQIKKAVKLRTAKKIHDEIVLPNIDAINKKLGQENDPMYLAYAVEYVVGMAYPAKKNPLLPIGGYWDRHELSLMKIKPPTGSGLSFVWIITHVTWPAYEPDRPRVVVVDRDESGDPISRKDEALYVAEAMAWKIVTADRNNPHPVLVLERGMRLRTYNWDAVAGRPSMTVLIK